MRSLRSQPREFGFNPRTSHKLSCDTSLLTFWKDNFMGVTVWRWIRKSKLEGRPVKRLL